jgi:hypothetical protein
VGESIKRKLPGNLSPAQLEAEVAPILLPALAMTPWDAVQAPLRIDLAGSAGDWSPAQVQQASDWLHGFVTGEKPRRADANAELKVTLPRVSPQLAASGAIAKAAARR